MLLEDFFEKTEKYTFDIHINAITNQFLNYYRRRKKNQKDKNDNTIIEYIKTSINENDTIIQNSREAIFQYNPNYEMPYSFNEKKENNGPIKLVRKMERRYQYSLGELLAPWLSKTNNGNINTKLTTLLKNNKFAEEIEKKIDETIPILKKYIEYLKLQSTFKERVNMEILYMTLNRASPA